MSDHPIIPADQILPPRLFVVPLNGKPIFPGILTPLAMPSQAEADTIEKAVAGDSFIGLILTRTEGAEHPSAEDLFTVGTAAKIVRKINLPDGGVNVFISTLKRFQGRFAFLSGKSSHFLTDHFSISGGILPVVSRIARVISMMAAWPLERL